MPERGIPGHQLVLGLTAVYTKVKERKGGGEKEKDFHIRISRNKHLGGNVGGGVCGMPAAVDS